ncbi:unnamed protein product, partial [Discosporangium mesarthrocarpum]
MMLSIVGYLVYRLGFSYLIPSNFKNLHLTPPEAQKVLDSHTFLFVGGPHRGGTTVLWECLREHPSVSGFADKVGADYSEGMFLQSVYPTMGIGSEMDMQQLGLGGARRRKRSKLASGLLEGLGAYAFNSAFHLTEDDATIEGRTMLVNEWGYLWDLRKPVLLEKSPPNMILSRYLQRMFSAEDLAEDEGEEAGTAGGAGGREEWGGEGVTRQQAEDKGREEMGEGIGGSNVRFVFITRHPIANALALGKYVGTGEDGMPDVFEQVLHWI